MTKEKTEYLSPRPGILAVSPSGKWDRELQEGLFNWVDPDFEGYKSTSGDHTGATGASAFDLVRDGTYAEAVPGDGFFNGSTQALQAVRDNPCLRREVLDGDRRVHVPFRNAEGESFVASVFLRGGELEVNVFKFSLDSVWDVKHGSVFILPQRALGDSETPGPLNALALGPLDRYAEMLEWLYLNTGDQLDTETRKRLVEKLRETLR